MTQTEIVSSEALDRAVRETIANHKGLIVQDDPGYIAAQEALKVIRAQEKEVENYFGPLVKKAHEMHKALKAKENAFTKPLQEVYSAISYQCSKYNLEKEKEARRKAAEEEARRRKIEEDRKIEEAKALEDSGRHEEAEEVISEPVVVAPVKIESAPRVQNVSYRDTWKFKIEKPGLLPREYTIPDEVKIGGVVRAMKGATNITGVIVWCEKSPIIK